MRKLAWLALALAACSDTSGSGSSVMTALVNGAPFTAQNPPGRQLGVLDTAIMELTVAGTRSLTRTSLESVVLSIRGFHGVGQYLTCGGASSAFGVYYRVDQSDSARLPPFYTTDTVCGGEIDVQSYTPALLLISGTFHFTATTLPLPDTVPVQDTVHVTDGQFDGTISISNIVVPVGVRGVEIRPVTQHP